MADMREHPGSEGQQGKEPEPRGRVSVRVQRRFAMALATVSALLIAGALAAFALTPGLTLDFGALFQTTAEEPSRTEGGSEQDSAKDGKESSAKKANGAATSESGAEDGDSGGDAPAAGVSASAQDGGASASTGSQGSGNTASGSTSASGDNGSSGAVVADTVTVSVSVDSSAAGGTVSASGTYTFERGATAYDALCALGLSVNAQNTGMGVYVAAIGGLAEKEHGSMSGWAYAVNGVSPNYSAGGYTLNDGDSVVWTYVTG